MIDVCIVRNVLDVKAWHSWTTTPDVHAYIREQFPNGLPDTAQFYHNYPAESHNVTPQNERDVDAIGDMDGRLYVVVYPADPITIGVIVAVVLAAVSLAAAFLFRPSTPKVNQTGSPNNSLSDRQNQARPNERIPELVGTVRATPDLIAAPYKVFEANREVEYANFCVCKGSITVHPISQNAGPYGTVLWDVRDDQTPVQYELGASVAVYGPNTSCNNGDTPQLQIGPKINAPVLQVKPCAGVTGQVLRPSNTYTITGNNNIYASDDGSFNSTDGNLDFSSAFVEGDVVTVSNAGMYDVNNNYWDLSGTYVVIEAGSQQLVFANPADVNSNWNNFVGQGATASPQFVSASDHWVGPYAVTDPSTQEVWANLVSSQGLFKVSGSSGKQYRIDVSVVMEITALDTNLQPIGNSFTYPFTVTGSQLVQTQRGATFKVPLPAAGPCSVRMKRTNPTDLTWQGTNQDTLQWRDLFGVSYPTVTNYGDVTTIQSKTIATASALTVQTRKLNLLVTRNLPSFAGSPNAPDQTKLVPTNNADDIIVYLARSPYNGRMADGDINFANIYNTVREVETYFGTTGAGSNWMGQFGYTFDDADVSFEEMLDSICQCICCTPYRTGRTLELFFEQPQQTGTLLFNHRNKIPDTEQRSVTFGYVNDNDGIELQYIDPFDPSYPNEDTTETLYFPQNRSAANPKKVTLKGCRNNVQATLVGWRLYQKLVYQRFVSEFSTLSEAAPLIINEAVLVADNTRADVIDGDMIDQNGLLLTTRQPVTLPAGQNVLYLQLIGNQVDMIPVTAIPGDSYKLLLNRAPVLPISTDPLNFVQAQFKIAPPSSARSDLFLVAEKTPQDHNEYDLKCVNYDSRYYNHDQDYANGTLTINQPPTSSGSQMGYYPAIPVMGGGYVYPLGGTVVINNTPVQLPSADFTYARSLALACVSQAYNSGDTIFHGIYSGSFNNGSPTSSARDGGDHPPFGQTSNWAGVFWTANAGVNLNGNTLVFKNANGDDLAFTLQTVADGGALAVPAGFNVAQSASFPAITAYQEAGKQSHGVGACSVSASGQVSAYMVDENGRLSQHGTVSVLTVWWKPNQGVNTTAVANGTAVLIPAANGNGVGLSFGQVPNGSNLGIPDNMTCYASSGAMAGMDAGAASHRSHGIFQCVLDTSGDATGLYADGEQNQWSGSVVGMRMSYGKLAYTRPQTPNPGVVVTPPPNPAATMQFAVPNHTYGDGPFQVAATSNSNAPIAYSVISGPAAVDSSNNVTLSGAGTVTMQAVQAAGENYTGTSQQTSFNVAPAVNTLQIAPIPDHVSTDLPFMVYASSNSPEPITFSVVSGPATISGNRVSVTGSGQVVIGATQPADTNYAAGSTTTSFNVAQGSTSVAPSAPYINGWNQHYADYEGGGGVNGHSWQLGSAIGYNNPQNAIDGNIGTACSMNLQHTHQYAGCVWLFNQAGHITGGQLQIASQAMGATSDGTLTGPQTGRCGIWYSLDGGATFTQVYNVQPRPYTVDTITIPDGQTVNQIQVMAFMDAHDNANHVVNEITLTGTIA